MAQLDNSLLADGNDPKANTDNSREELFRSKVRSRWEGLVASAQVVGVALGKWCNGSSRAHQGSSGQDRRGGGALGLPPDVMCVLEARLSLLTTGVIKASAPR